jgi:hypothetical protein
MSDTTFYSGLYQRISDYAELVDEVLLMFLEEDSQPISEPQKRLAQALLRLTDDNQEHTGSRLVSFLLNESDDIDTGDLSTAAEALLNGTANEVTNEVLEQFARVLERERTRAMARVRGDLR